MAHWRKLHLPDPRSAAKALCGAVGVDVRRLPGPDVEQYVRLFGEAAVRERRFYNVGAGGFSHPCWTNVDYGSDWYGPVQSNFVQYDLLGTDPLPVADGTAEIVYSSHSIEHIPEDAAQRLFNEAYRVLRPGGYVRLTCPDSDLSLAALRRDDEDFFYWDRSGTPIEHKWLDHGATSLVAQMSPADVRELIDDEQALKGLGGRYNYERPGDHVSRWNPEKLIAALGEAGFKAYRSGFGQSACPVLRNTRYFDNTHPAMSLYIEAVR